MKKNKTLNKLKAKRAKYAVGGYGYTGGSRNRSDSKPAFGYGKNTTKPAVQPSVKTPTPAVNSGYGYGTTVNLRYSQV